jgi:adenylate cyclase
MSRDEQSWTPEEQERWRKTLCYGDAKTRAWRWLQRFWRLLPTDPRCKQCYAPFAGIGGKLLSFTGIAPSRKNPRFCNT